MLGKSFDSPLLTFDSATRCISADFSTSAPSIVPFSINFSTQNVRRGIRTSSFSRKKWALYSALQLENIALDDEERKSWETSRQALSPFDFTTEEKDKILAKAFGHIHSPYWSEERKKETPQLETVNKILDYLRTLALSDDDLYKLLKKFPEVIGCSFEEEVRNNVQVLEKEWGIKGKTLRSLLLRNPKVLGYNVDCKGGLYGAMHPVLGSVLDI